MSMFAAALRSASQPIVVHCRSGTRSTLIWALTRLREGADPNTLIAEAASRHRHRRAAGDRRPPSRSRGLSLS
jgi:uncharacterized protein (TIGR01244 family)